MLSHKILTRQDVGDVASYYGDGADDYYAKEGEAQVWQGKGAEMLGLSGEVDARRFRELLAGKVDPDRASARLSTRDDSKTRIGVDLTFSAPKSVSIQALVGRDTTMIDAHDKAVARVLEEVETWAQARSKTAGVSRVEATGNLIIAKFRHETTRAQDPELHTHAVLMNLTRRADGEWRALKNDEIIQRTRYLGVLYRAELARTLEQQGHQLRYGRDGTFELASVSRPQIEAFSRRSAQIEARLAALGLTRDSASSAQRQLAAMQTREKKPKGLDRETMFAEWTARARELGIEFGARGRSDGAPPAYARSGAVADAEAGRQAVRYAIAHLMEREAAITASRLFDVALKHDLGRARLDAVLEAISAEVDQGRMIAEEHRYHLAGELAHTARPESVWIAELREDFRSEAQAQALLAAEISAGRLVTVEARYTTPEALMREREVLRIEREGRGLMKPMLVYAVAEEHFGRQPLNEGQKRAAALLLSSPHRVVGVEGFAGTGKSHMLRLANKKIEAQGFAVRALAPYGGQVRALSELGVKANTVASFLRAKDQGLTAKTLLVIDEAGVVPAREMALLLQAAEAAGARVALIGDRGQTKAIEAGRPFDQLIRAGMITTEMSEIQRQTEPQLKQAVELAARGQVKASLGKVTDLIEIADDRQRRIAISQAYAALPADQRDKTLIVAGTNEARREINANVRQEIGTAGRGFDTTFLLRRDTTQEERRFSRNYDVGDTIQPERDYRCAGLVRGTLYQVEENGPGNRLKVRAADGTALEFNPHRCSNLSVYRAERAELALGDIVRVTRNDAALDVANGERFTVAARLRNSVLLRSERREVFMKTDKPVHLDHAYATTVHSSQGLTAERTFIEAVTTSRTTAKDVYYVAISRARSEARIFTDDRTGLSGAISRQNPKIAAMDLATPQAGLGREHRSLSNDHRERKR